MNTSELEAVLIKIWLLCGEYMFLVSGKTFPMACCFYVVKSSLYLNLVISFHHRLFKEFYLLIFVSVSPLPLFLHCLPPPIAYFRNFCLIG